MAITLLKKQGRVRLSRSEIFGTYYIEVRLQRWLPFWWNMGKTRYEEVAYKAFRELCNEYN